MALRGKLDVGRRHSVLASGAPAFAFGACLAAALMVALFYIAKASPVPARQTTGGPRPQEAALPPPVVPGQVGLPAGSMSLDSGPLITRDVPNAFMESQNNIELPPARPEEPRLEQPDNPAPPPEPVPDEPEEEPKPVEKKDHIAKVTKYEYYIASLYGLSFTNVPESYYAEVVLQSYRNPRWVLNHDGWIKAKRETSALTNTGRTLKCYAAWPVDYVDEKATLVKMLYIVPNGSVIKEVIVDGKHYPAPKMIDSGR